MAELELVRTIEAIGRRNAYRAYLSFLGGGAYDHFIPTVVDYLSSRGEFVSPYTPYQPEVSQGTLQVIFEFQTLICQLTGLDIANASLYEGATAAAEAVLMAHRLTGRTKVVLVARPLHPQYREVIRTYIKNLGIEAVEIPYGTRRPGRRERPAPASWTTRSAGVVYQSPNFFGVIEDAQGPLRGGPRPEGPVGGRRGRGPLPRAPRSAGAARGRHRHGRGAVVRHPPELRRALSRLHGLPKKEFVRQLPGRIAGQTVDMEGRRGFVLTLSTREQHIRRERATSNICTNQALCALRATIFLETLGKQGLREMAWQNAQKAAYAADRLAAVPGVKRRFTGPVFNEFVVEFPKPWAAIDAALRKQGIVAGYGLGTDYPELKSAVLICVTELRTKDEIDRLARALQEVLS